MRQLRSILKGLRKNLQDSQSSAILSDGQLVFHPFLDIAFHKS